jgi:antitoxin component YwqK of YwqJK toxin-antitoxin module
MNWRDGRVVEGGRFEIYCARSRTGGSNPPLSATSGFGLHKGEVTEWLKVRDWKSRVGQLTGGSNPPLSASQPQECGSGFDRSMVFECRGEGRGPKTGSCELRQVREEATVAVRSGLWCSPALSSALEQTIRALVLVGLVACAGRSGVHTASPLPKLVCPEGAREVVRALEQWCEHEEVRQGPWRAWHTPQSVRAEGAYDKGRRYGDWSEFFDTGNPKSLGSYGGAGLRQGAWSWWFEDGTRSATGAYEGGDAHGLWTRWYPTGERASEGAFAHGQRHGGWRFWHPNGVVAAEGLYEHGEPSGPWTYWDADSHTLTETSYLEAYGPLP